MPALATSPTITDWMPALVMVVAVVTLGVVLTLSIRLKIARRQAARPDPREMIEKARASQRQRDAIDGASVEFLETTRRLAAQLDFKSRKLEQLIADADERIAALRRDERQPARAADPPADPSTNGPAAAPVPAPPAPPADPLTASVHALADEGHDAVEIARRLEEHPGKVELILALRSPPAPR